jgi:hypothetical protein
LKDDTVFYVLVYAYIIVIGVFSAGQNDLGIPFVVTDLLSTLCHQGWKMQDQ